MRITILGSAAAEGWPALFCECAACVEAWRRGGKDIRRRTAYAVNADTLVDFGPDIYAQSITFGVDLARLRHLFVTHSHSDHLSPIELTWRRRGYSVVSAPLRLYGNRRVLERVHDEVCVPLEDLRIVTEEMQPGTSVTAGNLQVTALEADHAADETALNYVLEQNGATLLIANDTGWWPESTWRRIENFRLDAAIIECTYLLKNPDQQQHHLGARATLAMKDELAARGALRPNAQVIANHFSHNGLTLHEELTTFFTPHNIAVGYDGMVIDI